MCSEDAIVSTPEQTMRAKLREGFLKEVAALNGEECSILTYEQSTLHATFCGWKPDGSEILVTGLQTPASAFLDSALLRCTDLLAVTFNKPLE